jgi:hypothetical protein
MSPLRYRLTAPLPVGPQIAGHEFVVPAGTIVIPATLMSGAHRVALAEEVSGRTVRVFPTELEREFWITKNARLEV